MAASCFVGGRSKKTRPGLQDLFTSQHGKAATAFGAAAMAEAAAPAVVARTPARQVASQSAEAQGAEAGPAAMEELAGNEPAPSEAMTTSIAAEIASPAMMTEVPVGRARGALHEVATTTSVAEVVPSRAGKDVMVPAGSARGALREAAMTASMAEIGTSRGGKGVMVPAGSARGALREAATTASMAEIVTSRATGNGAMAAAMAEVAAGTAGPRAGAPSQAAAARAVATAAGVESASHAIPREPLAAEPEGHRTKAADSGFHAPGPRDIVLGEWTAPTNLAASLMSLVSTLHPCLVPGQPLTPQNRVCSDMMLWCVSYRGPCKQ